MKEINDLIGMEHIDMDSILSKRLNIQPSRKPRKNFKVCSVVTSNNTYNHEGKIID